jgi:hypothetical protein
MPKFNKKKIDKSRLGKEEINFPEFPLGIVSQQQPKDLIEKLEFRDVVGNDEIKVTILPSSLGYPNQTTRDLLRALMRITWQKNGFKDPKVTTSIREIIRELGMSASGQALELIKKHLRILAGTRIEYEKSFFDKELSDRIKSTISINIITSFLFEELESRTQNKELKKKGGYSDLLKSGISWNQEFFEISLKDSRNLIDFDYTYYITLENHLSKELYLLLNKRSYNKSFFKIEMKILAFEKLGISRTLESKLFKVRQLLKKAHKELIDSGFIKKEPLFKKENGIEYVTYYFHEQQYLFDEPAGEHTQDITSNSEIRLSEKENEVRNMLMELNFTEGEAGKILREYGDDFTSKIIKLYRKQKGVRSPKKWIFTALYKRYDVSEIEEEIRIENQKAEEAKVAEQKLIEVQEQKAKSNELSDKIDVWIGQNPSKYYSKCLEFLQELEESKQTFYLDLISRESVKSGKTKVEIIMENSILSSMVRSKIII